VIVKKSINGELAHFDLVLIKEYEYFGLYQVNRLMLINGEIVPIKCYRESYTPQQLAEIMKNQYFIREEVFS